MVMATGDVCQQFSGVELPSEVGEAAECASAESTALHERLVAYVHALAGAHEPRSGVWVEHSYARARGATHAPAAHVRVLLAPRRAPDPPDVDVERDEPPPPSLPALTDPSDEPATDRDSDPDHDDDWEARVAALAPSAVHARLADQALDLLRRMRLERLVSPTGAAAHEAARAAARRLRLALAGAAAHPAAHAQRPGAWLHATLHAYLPRAERRLYDELAAELRRAAPRLAERTLGGSAPLPHSCRPWLVWVGCGRARLDERWRRRLGALLHTRVVAAGGAARAAPDAWCAAVAGGVRAALTDALLEAGERPVFLGGIGAGAALAVALAGVAGAAGAARVRGLLLLAPPLLTAEGSRDTPDDPLAEIRLPMLVVAGTGAANCWRGAAREVVRGGARRLLELRGADEALRLAGAARRRRGVPQLALDAAVAEECARWALEVAASDEQEETGARRLSEDDEEEDYAHLPAAEGVSAPLTGPSGLDRTTETVAESSSRRATLATLEQNSSGPAGDARLVSRGSAATPLALLPPRRRAASPAAPPPPGPARRRAASPPGPAARRRRTGSPAPAAGSPLGAADIMRLPIVFADDEPGLEPEPAASPVTVTSGSRTYTRVIVASRGTKLAAAARALRASRTVQPVRPGPVPAVRPGPVPAVRPGPVPAVRPGPVRPGPVRPGRPVLLRRGLRLLPRTDRPH